VYGVRCIYDDPFSKTVQELNTRINQLYQWPKNYGDALRDPRCGCDESGKCEWNNLDLIYMVRDLMQETDQLFPREEFFTTVNK